MVLPLSIKTIAHTLGYAPFTLWLSFSIDLFVNIIRTVKRNEFIRLLKIIANTVVVAIPDT